MTLRDGDRPSDEELAERIRRDPGGSEAIGAGNELFERYQERVYLWCFRRVRDHETACDLAQDVLIQAWRSAGRFEGRARYSSWLFAIARNRCHRAMRRPRLWRDEDAEPDAMADRAAALPDVELEEAQDEERLLEAVREALDEREQTVLWLRCFEGLPVEEITRRLAIPGSAGARAVLQSARRKLRQALEKRAASKRGSDGWR